MSQTINHPSIMSYEGKIWKTADILRSSAGLKNSDFPSYMMPFMALRMLESRLIRKIAEIEMDEDYAELTDEDEKNEYLQSECRDLYNSFIFSSPERKTIAKITENDKTFNKDMSAYLDGWSDEIKGLLGIVAPDPTENMALGNIINSLKKKNVLFGYTLLWGEIDLTPYNNSEVTTLEEHIKRKWADMSAETAGEQYTPEDIINLISKLITHKSFKKDTVYKIYDMTCGGGNMLYGIEDRLREKYPSTSFTTYGQELNGALYALAKIESKFRNGSFIERGNTLTEDKHAYKNFNVIVANPPYGVPWTEEKEDIDNDQTGRFDAGKPSVGDGQLLFVQHAIHHMEKKSDISSAFIVLNGSPMFSGDAGSGESMIRKWILDNDYLEALIQLPTNEFFNTGIQSYIWCLNADKSSEMKDKILCINAEDLFVGMKKNLNMKSKEISDEQAEIITNIYYDYVENGISENSSIAKLKSKYDFYYNKQDIQVLQVNDDNRAFLDGNDNVSITMKDIKELHVLGQSHEEELIVGDILNAEQYENLVSLSKDIDEKNVVIILNNGEEYAYAENDHCIYHKKTTDGFINVGYGKITLKPKVKKSRKSEEVSYDVAITLEPVWEKDVEKTPYSPDEDVNKQLITDYMTKWVSEDESLYRLLDNRVGVEFNFNTIFPKGIDIRSTKEIMAEIDVLDEEMNELMRLIKE